MLRRLAPLAAAAAIALLPATALAQPPDPAARSCDWPMFGHTALRTFATDCPQAPDSTSVRALHPRWVVHTSDVVTAPPAVSGGSVYAGAWDGTFYAIDQASGAIRWRTVLGNAAPAPWTDAHHLAFGQITSSAAVATVAGTRTVFASGAASLYALDAATGAYLWRFDVDPQQPTELAEIESSPVVWAAGTPNGHPWVVFGADANQNSDFPGEGLWAVDAVTHEAVWHFNPEAFSGKALYGCGNVWSSPALDLDPHNPDPSRQAMLFFGTADCPDNGSVPCPTDGTDPHCPAGGSYDYAQRWQPYAEAMIGLDARTGQPLWSYQPHPANNTADDDFGSSAQVFTLPGPHGDHRVVGEGNKDGTYQVVDRNSGAPLWRAVEQGNGNIQSSQAIGGFIGNTAVGGAPGSPRVFGGSAIDTPVTYDPATGQPIPQSDPTAGATPMRAFAAADGTPAWQAAQGPTYGASSTAHGVVYNGALDGLLRAYDAGSGLLLWSFPLGAPISSGAAIAGSDVVIGTGTSDNQLDQRTPVGVNANPLSHTGEIWDFTTAAVGPSLPFTAPQQAGAGVVPPIVAIAAMAVTGMVRRRRRRR
jgi:polyvinyl alcohol dehydrogenase (cytochrome)